VVIDNLFGVQSLSEDIVREAQIHVVICFAFELLRVDVTQGVSNRVHMAHVLYIREYMYMCM
jgi:hypothetical protein